MSTTKQCRHLKISIFIRYNTELWPPADLEIFTFSSQILLQCFLFWRKGGIVITFLSTWPEESYTIQRGQICGAVNKKKGVLFFYLLLCVYFRGEDFDFAWVRWRARSTRRPKCRCSPHSHLQRNWRGTLRPRRRRRTNQPAETNVNLREQLWRGVGGRLFARHFREWLPKNIRRSKKYCRLACDILFTISEGWVRLVTY